MDLKKSYINNKIKDYYIQQKYNKKTQKDIIYEKYLEKSLKEKRIEYKKKEYIEICKKDKIYKIIYNLNKRTEDFFKKSRYKNKINHESMLGCTPEELKKHLESLFEDKMTFDNYPEWEVDDFPLESLKLSGSPVGLPKKVDHIIPLSSIDFDKYYEMEKVLHYTNLQPLWLKENRSKGSKII
jgi:hypothetical protein